MYIRRLLFVRLIAADRLFSIFPYSCYTMPHYAVYAIYEIQERGGFQTRPLHDQSFVNLFSFLTCGKFDNS